ncbi:sulfate permease family protein [Nitzschia inconspicua]|uniref:Sulfate permease family protein n=1 Tax=Nitzschia inconspicua TaxID=303405 RepID=A0A9K3KY01_9STRA|nr:sulfate permease family protein [Nitzschia inconspicua]
MATHHHADQSQPSSPHMEPSFPGTSPTTSLKAIRLISRRSFQAGCGDTIGSMVAADNADGRHDNPSSTEFLSSSLTTSRRRVLPTTKDASNTMNRLLVSMVGHTGNSTVDDYKDDENGRSAAPFAPHLFSSNTADAFSQHDDKSIRSSTQSLILSSRTSYSKLFTDGWIVRALGQIPSIALIGIFHLMIGVPFGVSYFPMQWTSSTSESTFLDLDGDLPHGDFPVPGKEAFGIRLFLFSTMIGQIIFTFFSGFPNPIGLQMVENIGFTKELAAVAISHQGYGIDAMATLMVMFGLASLLVGVVFYLLGRFRLGKIVYFFPTHVLIGLIGGIGILLCKTGLEVTIADAISISHLIQSWRLWTVILGLEASLRVLEWITSDSRGKPKFALLSPIFFCMITPLFYLTLLIFRVPVSAAEDSGYFFPPMVQTQDSDVRGNFGTPWDVWKVIDFSKVSWVAIVDSFPTMVALILFSLIHVPINIPAFALSTKVDVDMNQELIAHGYSNMLAGFCCGLQNYMAYTQSVLYDKSGGTGRISGLAVAAVTGCLFFVGPSLATYIPRCMAGTLLLHVGIDLFLEGVYDSFKKFDWLEYCGIWLIVVVMSFCGMEAAMVAGGVAAVSTYAVQNVAYLSPIRGVMPATTLRSSHWNRSRASESILENPTEGRSRILVVQLQGHLFFGNMASFTERIHALLKPAKQVSGRDNMPPIIEDGSLSPLVLVLDCSLVLGIDSSAAHAIVKLKEIILKQYNIRPIIFVSGSEEGFPTEYNLRDQLSGPSKKKEDSRPSPTEASPLLATQTLHPTDCLVCDSLDLALMEAEDAIIARHSQDLVCEDNLLFVAPQKKEVLTLEEEQNECISCLKDISPQQMSENDAAILFSHFKREAYKQDDLVWVQGDESNSVKLVVSGQLIAELENEAGTTELVTAHNIVGELGLVNGDARMSTLRVTSQEAILYSMSREAFEELMDTHPRVARYIDLICVKFLALRVQHVSNRIFETRCLPI